MSSETAPQTFRATVQLDGKTATGIRVPDEVVAALGGGKRVPVVVTLAGGHTYRSTVATRGDAYLLPVSAEHRERAGVAASHEVDVTLELDTQPREVEVPEDLAGALAHAAEAARAVDALSPSKRPALALSVSGAKGADTRQRRVERALATLREG